MGVRRAELKPQLCDLELEKSLTLSLFICVTGLVAGPVLSRVPVSLPSAEACVSVLGKLAPSAVENVLVFT